MTYCKKDFLYGTIKVNKPFNSTKTDWKTLEGFWKNKRRGWDDHQTFTKGHKNPEIFGTPKNRGFCEFDPKKRGIKPLEHTPRLGFEPRYPCGKRDFWERAFLS